MKMSDLTGIPNAPNQCLYNDPSVYVKTEYDQGMNFSGIIPYLSGLVILPIAIRNSTKSLYKHTPGRIGAVRLGYAFLLIWLYAS